MSSLRSFVASCATHGLGDLFTEEEDKKVIKKRVRNRAQKSRAKAPNQERIARLTDRAALLARIFDGEEHVLREGVDFTGSAEKFRAELYGPAYRKALRVSASVSGSEVRMRARPVLEQS